MITGYDGSETGLDGAGSFVNGSVVIVLWHKQSETLFTAASSSHHCIRTVVHYEVHLS